MLTCCRSADCLGKPRRRRHGRRLSHETSHPSRAGRGQPDPSPRGLYPIIPPGETARPPARRASAARPHDVYDSWRLHAPTHRCAPSLPPPARRHDNGRPCAVSISESLRTCHLPARRVPTPWMYSNVPFATSHLSPFNRSPSSRDARPRTTALRISLPHALPPLRPLPPPFRLFSSHDHLLSKSASPRLPEKFGGLPHGDLGKDRRRGVFCATVASFALSFAPYSNHLRRHLAERFESPRARPPSISHDLSNHKMCSSRLSACASAPSPSPPASHLPRTVDPSARKPSPAVRPRATRIRLRRSSSSDPPRVRLPGTDRCRP
jgi:hypothetical protein